MSVFVILCVLLNLIIKIQGNGLNGTTDVAPLADRNNRLQSNQTRSRYTWSNGTEIEFNTTINRHTKHGEVDCLGIGTTISNSLAWLFLKNDSHSNILDITFLLTSRNHSKRAKVIVGNHFGLEWTDFKIERKTVFIVHGFLSTGHESWIREMEEAYLSAEDVNVVVVDWGARANTWNYYRAAVNARIIGHEIAKFLSHIVNDTISTSSSDTKKWGSIHMIGHSLGAHICGVAADEFKKLKTAWEIKRITGLDPAQPCFSSSHLSLDVSDASFVDIIHTNGRLMSKLGLGLPNPIGHMDFYPNGGKVQPGCVTADNSILDYLGIPKSSIEEAICSHGRSYLYFTESIIASVTNKGTFWGHTWDRSYRRAVHIMDEVCNENHCVEMGIRAENYRTRGTFFVMTSSRKPFYDLSLDNKSALKEQLRHDFGNHYLD